MVLRSPISLVLCCLALACGSNERASEATASGGGGAGPTEPALDAPAAGFQLRTEGTTIEPGQDIELCEILEVPGEAADEYLIDRWTFAMTPYSHHLNVRAIVPGTQADASTQVGDRVVCDNNGGDPYGQGFTTLGGSQELLAEATYPAGVGFRLFGGQKILVNYHYLNSSSEAVPARHALNFHLAQGTIDRVVRRFGMYNLSIDIPPRSRTSFTMECRMRQDVMLHGLTRHTHQWGTEFDAWFAGGSRDGEHIFTSTDYDRAQEHRFDEPVLVRAGEGFRFECNFDNTTDRALRFGSKATDEMCILYGSWFVVNVGDAEASQDCIAVEHDDDHFSTGFPCAECPDGQLF